MIKRKHQILTVISMLLLLLCMAASVQAAPRYKNVLRKVDGKIYYYDSKGKRIKSTWKTIKEKRYYFQKSGAAAVGPTKIKAEKYLFSAEGILQKNGYKTYKGTTYYVNTKGQIKNPPVKKQADSEAKSKSLAPLENKLKKAIKSYKGTWSVYVKNLNTGESICINNQKMYAASLIKLYAAGAAYDKIEKKKMKETKTVKSHLSSMITVSDNWCFNDIVHRIGKTAINEWCKKNGYNKTSQGRGILGVGNEQGLYNGTGSNYTSVADCGKFLEDVYRGRCVSSLASGKILKLLKRQTRRTKIPAGVPSGVTVANKTGETDDYCHDAAIVYSKKAVYIICVMGRVKGNAWNSAGHVKSLSRITYKYFN